MIRTIKLIKYFPNYLNGLYPDQKHNAELAAKLVGHHLLIFNDAEREIYVKHFFISHASRYGILAEVGKEVSQIKKFIQTVLENMPDGADHINPRAMTYLSEFSEKQASNIYDYVSFERFSEGHILLTDIILESKVKIKLMRTLMNVIEKEGIEVKLVTHAKRCRRFITKADYNKLIEYY